METKNILETQSKVRLTLNGGKSTLDDATIPFQIAFDKSVMDEKPTHILVMDITDTSELFNDKGEREGGCDAYGERTLFNLEPINYLQFKRPGVHHLIFILLKGVRKDQKKYLLEKSSRYRYENELWFGGIEENKTLHSQVGYAEVIVEIPEVFFSTKPKTKAGQAIWDWTNRWFDLAPIDQCEYRKRAMLAFTIQPIVWILGLLLRLFTVAMFLIVIFIRDFFSILVGYQPMRFIPNKRLLFWEFLIVWQDGSTKKIFDGETWIGAEYEKYEGQSYEPDYYTYRTYGIGNKRLFIPVALFEVFFYPVLIFALITTEMEYLHLDIGWKNSSENILELLVLSCILTAMFSFVTLPNIKKDEKWKSKFRNEYSKTKDDKIFFITVIILCGINLLSFTAWGLAHVPWINVWHFLTKMVSMIVIAVLLVSVLTYILYKIGWVAKVVKSVKETQIPFRTLATGSTDAKGLPVVVDKHQQWLEQSFKLEALPEKVDLKTAPKSSSVVHTFYVSFWALKAQVCKPFAK